MDAYNILSERLRSISEEQDTLKQFLLLMENDKIKRALGSVGTERMKASALAALETVEQRAFPLPTFGSTLNYGMHAPRVSNALSAQPALPLFAPAVTLRDSTPEPMTAEPGAREAKPETEPGATEPKSEPKVRKRVLPPVRLSRVPLKKKSYSVRDFEIVEALDNVVRKQQMELSPSRLKEVSEFRETLWIVDYNGPDRIRSSLKVKTPGGPPFAVVPTSKSATGISYIPHKFEAIAKWDRIHWLVESRVVTEEVTGTLQAEFRFVPVDSKKRRDAGKYDFLWHTVPSNAYCKAFYYFNKIVDPTEKEKKRIAASNGRQIAGIHYPMVQAKLRQIFPEIQTLENLIRSECKEYEAILFPKVEEGAEKPKRQKRSKEDEK